MKLTLENTRAEEVWKVFVSGADSWLRLREVDSLAGSSRRRSKMRGILQVVCF